MVRIGEDLDVGFYSNMKVSLTFSTVRWLLILVAFLQAADGTARPVDIYKLIRLRAMAFYKEKRLRMSHQSPVSTAQSATQEHVSAFNKQKSTFPERKSFYHHLPFRNQ